MSRPRSRSPRYRRFPWEEPGFDAHRLLAELDGIPMDRSHHFREGPEEPRDYFRKEMYPEGQRRSPSFPEDHQFGRRPDQEEFYHRGLSPHHGSMRYEDRRLPLPHDGGNDVDRRRGGFREHSESFETRTRSPQSPLRLQRERLTPTPRPHSAQRESGKGWRGEEPGRGRGRLRDLSPGTRSDDPRAAADRERGRKSTQGSNRGRQRENPHHERNLPFKRQRREMDDVDQLGYREEFGEQGYSVDSSGDGYGGDTRGKLPLGDVRRSRPVVIEHGHGITGSREVPRWEQFDNRRDRDPDFDRQRSPRPMSASQERFRMSDSRMDGREDTRERHFQDNTRDSNFHETRRSPVQDRPNTTRFDNRVGPMNHRGRGSDRPLKRNYNQVQGGRIGQGRSQPRLQKGYQERPHEDQRPGYRPFREDYDDHIEEKPSWAEEHKLQQWDRPGSLDRHLQRVDLDPKMPRQRLQAWGDQKTDNATVVTEETLTIKVDMSRPVNQNSSLCYSSDRQLSLDLVNVGRQRLDFLPMLEHSGTYRETAMHTGTFAQEIITLVHLVKDQYFRDDGVTLNERFSAPQKGGYSEEEMEEELTLDQRFSSNRGFSLDMSSLLHDDEPLFSRLGPMQGLSQQPIRGPGDLRHDLERRRQEKLEGVKVTIPGNSMSQRPLGHVSELDLEYSEQMSPMDHEGFSNWPEEQNRRRDGNMGPRRGPSNRLNTGPQRRNNRFGNRRPNAHSSSAGPSW